ncbi:MAG TPA: prolyl oligopeptidase family serine peptidase, partial [Thermoanaerobaculia bacterium]|nr:prolyl oligopeptidase family serine peptidase [Thermoanaerobaculia bacterium]
MRGPWVSRCGVLAVAILFARGAAAEGEALPVVSPPDSLVSDGLPAIPAALVEKAVPYLESRAATFQTWHPIRREALVTTRFADTAQVHRVRMPGGARTQLTFYPDRILSASYPPRRTDGFIFTKDSGGAEFYQLFWFDEATRRVTMLTDGKSRNSFETFTPDGRFVLFTSTKRNGKDTDVYLAEPSDPSSVRLLLQVESPGWSATDVAPDGKTVLLLEYVSATESRLHLLDVATGVRTLLTPPGAEKVFYGRARFAKDGKGIYATSDRGFEFHALFRFDLSSATWEPLTAARPWDVESFDVSDDGGKLVYVLNEGGSNTIHLVDLGSRAELPLPHVPLGVVTNARFHPSGREIGFTLSSARSPADFFSIDLASGSLVRWTESETGGLDAGTFVEPERIAWKSFDGKMISGFLYRPPARFIGKRPVMISIHGGPEEQARPRYLGATNFYLNELGVALIFPNVRGSHGFGKTFVSLDDGEKREDSVKDVGALLDWVAAQPLLDASRVMVTGGSYGGYMTLATMTHFSDRLRCGLDVVGISNFVTFLTRTEAYRQDLRRVEYGDERDPKMRAFLEQISPLT